MNKIIIILLLYFAILPIFSHAMYSEYEPFLQEQMEVEKKAKKNKEYVNLSLHKMNKDEVYLYYKNKLHLELTQQKFKALFLQIQRLKQ